MLVNDLICARLDLYKQISKINALLLGCFEDFDSTCIYFRYYSIFLTPPSVTTFLTDSQLAPSQTLYKLNEKSSIMLIVSQIYYYC